MLRRADAQACAPSFLDLGGPDDRIVSTNSFSKAWLMTGWRLGWIVAPPALMPDLGKLIEYNTSCSPVFVQRAGVAAIRDGEPCGRADAGSASVAARDLLVARARPPARRSPSRARRARCTRSSASPAMADSLAFCKRLVREAELGLAPGSAFGPEGEGFIRWCFAADTARLADGVARFARFCAAHAA